MITYLNHESSWINKIGDIMAITKKTAKKTIAKKAVAKKAVAKKKR